MTIFLNNKILIGILEVHFFLTKRAKTLTTPTTIKTSSEQRKEITKQRDGRTCIHIPIIKIVDSAKFRAANTTLS